MGFSVHIERIHKKFSKDGPEILKGVTFDIDKGTKIGILGPNGAGKTTLISIICGLLSPSAGTVKFFSSEEIDYHEAVEKIGLVPQEYAFYERLTPIQNLKYFGALYHLDPLEIEKRAKDLLELLGLKDFQHKKVKSFSGGMKRRLNLAIGLIHDPEIIFLDEPTVGVDVQSKNAIMIFLEELNKEGKTIVYTSHHLNEAQSFCTDVVLIDHGEIIVKQSMDQLIAENSSHDLQTIFIEKTGGQYRD